MLERPPFQLTSDDPAGSTAAANSDDHASIESDITEEEDGRKRRRSLRDRGEAVWDWWSEKAVPWLSVVVEFSQLWVSQQRLGHPINPYQ